MHQPIKNLHAVPIIALCLVAAGILFFVYSSGSSSVVTQPVVPTQSAATVRKATLNFSPSTQSVTVGSKFTVNVVLDTGGQAVYGVDLNRLRFNPSILQVVDSDTKIAGVQVTPGPLMSMTVVNSVDNKAGTLQFSQLVTPRLTINGVGTIASVTFKVISTGVANVSLDSTPGSGTDSNVAGSEGDILSSVGSGSYTATK